MKRYLKISLRVIIILFILVNILAAVHSYKFIHFYDPSEVSVKPDSAFQTVFLKTSEGIQLEGWYIPVASPKGTVALFHGHGDKKTDVLAEAHEFLKLGYNTFLIDFRASGSSGGNTCTIGYDEAEDVKIVYDHIRSKGEKNVILWGMSMGAATISTALARYDDCKPEKIILELPFSSMHKAIKAKLRLMELPEQPTAALLSFWASVENGFWVFDHEPSDYVKEITCPVLLQFGKKDPRVTEDQRIEIDKNLNAPKQVVIYEHSAHESLLQKEPEKWISTVTNFLQR